MTDEFEKARDEWVDAFDESKINRVINCCKQEGVPYELAVAIGLGQGIKHGADWAYDWHKQELADLKKANDILRAMVLVVQDKGDKLAEKLAKADKIIKLNMGSTLDEVLSWESEKERGEE